MSHKQLLLTCIIGLLGLFRANESHGQSTTFEQLVSGVSQLTSSGLSGPVYAEDTNWVAIASGDEDSSFPSVYVMARNYGAGRVVIIGHEGIADRIDLLDNRQFMVNIISWLDPTVGKKVVSTSSFPSLQTELLNRGYAFQVNTISSNNLVGRNVLIAGNSWNDFTPAQISTVSNFVTNGGGLVLLGLGWSWAAYHPQLTMEDYPMIKLAKPYGARWLQGAIEDPTHQTNGSAIFHVFHPDISMATVEEACTYITSINAAYPATLPSVLQTNSAVRLQYVRAHQLLQIPAAELPWNSPQRTSVFQFYKEMCSGYPALFNRLPSFNRTSYPTMTHIRERVFRTFVDLRPLTSQIKSDIAASAAFPGQHANLLTNFNIALLDNAMLDTAQKDFLLNYLSNVPTSLHDLRAITVNEFFGTPSIQVPIWGLGGGINIFGIKIANAAENSFPADVAPGYTSTFCAAAAHEVNHVVDSFYIARTPPLKARKEALIAAAGRDQMNYLRSMIPAGYFADNPQEFFASIANQWFTDSAKTIQLGLVRMNQGRREPLNQAIYFADVYSQSNNQTLFYSVNTSGQISRTTVSLERDNAGFIRQMTFGGATYVFNLDLNGNAVSYVPTITTQPMSKVVSLGSNLSLSVIAIGMPPITYQWRLNGTNIVGETNSTLTISNITASQTGSYTVYVSSPGGSTLSQPASITANGRLATLIVAGLLIEGTVGSTYSIQSTLDLPQSGPWIALTNLTLTRSPELWVDLSSTNATKRFYRAVLQQ